MKLIHSDRGRFVLVFLAVLLLAVAGIVDAFSFFLNIAAITVVIVAILKHIGADP